MFYATDTWADGKDEDGVECFALRTEVPTRAGPETRYRPMGRQLPVSIEQFLLRWFALHSTLGDWDRRIIHSLEISASKGTMKMSQTALAELAIRTELSRSRTGETPPNVSWPDVVDMEMLKRRNWQSAISSFWSCITAAGCIYHPAYDKD